MPQTTALTLLPPTPPPAPPIASYSQTPDSSFQQTLESAQQKQSAQTDSDSDPSQVDNQTSTDEKVTKKAAKPTKAKKPVAAKQASDADDSTGTAAKTDEAKASAINTEATSDPAPIAKKTANTDPKKAATTNDSSVPVAATPIPTTDNTPSTQANGKKTADGLAIRKPAVVKTIGTKQTDDADTTQAAANDSASEDSTNPTTAALATDSTKATSTVKPVGFGNTKVASANDNPTANSPAVAQPHTASTSDASSDDAPSAQTAADVLATADEADANPHEPALAADGPALPNFEQQLQRALAPESAKIDAPAPPPTSQPQFAEANHPTIVTGVHSQLLPNGGSMQIQLNPPELGELQVNVQIRNGVMSASFETSNDQASRVLSHSLNQLKTALESTGVTVEKMHVQQSPKQQSQSNSGDSQQQQHDPEQQQQARQDQQRRQMLQKMWSKLAGVEDPLDLVA